MDIKDLDKKQLILLTLLITFIVSIATGIVTVSLMQQMPKSVPQSINNVIQKTIEKVTTIEVPVSNNVSNDNEENNILIGDGDVMVSVYAVDNSLSESSANILDGQSIVEDNNSQTEDDNFENNINSGKFLGEGIIISDVGLVLVESNILDGYQKYKIILNNTDFEVSILKKFGNGFTILKILSKQELEKKKEVPATATL